MRSFLRRFYVPGRQAETLFGLSKLLFGIPLIGKGLSHVADLLLLYIFGIDLNSNSINVKEVVFGHTNGIVLGANGVTCTGKLHLSSNVVLGRRYGSSNADAGPFFDFTGDVTIGANSVLLGPLKIVGPVIIGAMSLVTKDILDPGVYVGAPAKKIAEMKASK